MQSDTKYLSDILSKESRLPSIDADACVYAVFDQAGCNECVDACPKQAWVLNDDALGLDTDACDGCGLCVPACHSGALHVRYPWVIRKFNDVQTALFACEYSDINENSGILPCVHALGVRQLLQLNKTGIHSILITTANCESCFRHQPEDIHQRLKQVNNLLREREQSPMEILQRSSVEWKAVFYSESQVDQATRISRRHFLRKSGELLRSQQASQDPLNQSEYRNIPPGKLLPVVESPDLHWPWSPELDESLCNGCDACIKLCPTDALQLSQNEEKHSPSYQLTPASCTGCGICTEICELKAISVHRYSRSATRTIHLMEQCCSGCGNTFHLPHRNNSQTSLLLCRICQNHNHNKNLYQVLGDN